MSDELRIELQVTTDTEKVESQLNSLINEFNNKKPIDLKVNLGNTNLETFKDSIKSITGDLHTLSTLKFNNLNDVEASLKKISNLVKDFQGLSKNNSSNTGTKNSNAVLDTIMDGLNIDDIERLSSNHKEALKEVKFLQENAEFLKDGFKAYKDSIKEAEKIFKSDNADLFSFIDELEKSSNSSHFKRLIKYKKELNQVVNEYNTLGVSLTDVEKITNEKYDGTMASRKYQEYLDTMGLSAEKFEQLVERAKQLNARKRQLLKNLENNTKKATDEEKATFATLSKMYDEMPKVDTSKADSIRESLVSVLDDKIFKLDFGNLDLRFEEDFEQAYNKFFDILKKVQNEYNDKFKNIEGFEELNIFDPNKLEQDNKELKEEVEKTIEIVDSLKEIGKGSLEKLGFDANALDTFNTLENAINSLEGKLDSLKGKFSNAFEITGESLTSLDKIKDALVEINKLTEKQKQTFFDLELDTDNIEKAKKETKELNETLEDAPTSSYDGLIESYSRLQNASGAILREMEKVRLSSMSTVTLKYGYEEDDNGNMKKQLETAEFSDNISKRTKELLKEYTSASNDLVKAQKEYYEAVNGGKASENTINKLSDNVKEMESNLTTVRKSISELKEYPDVMDALFEDFNKLDEARHKQTELDALKIIDKKELAEANELLKQSKTLIDNISKDNVQLQKDLNAGYDDTSKKLEDRIKSQEKQLTNNISKLMNISNSKAAIDQIFSYQLEKASKTEIEIARLKDKANKNTGTKTVDEQDEYLKEYKRYLTELKAIQKSLTKESNETARTEKIFQLDKTFKQLDEIKAKLNQIKGEAAQGLFDKTMRELDLNLSNNFSRTSSELDKVEAKISKLSKSNYVDRAAISSVESTIDVLRNALNKGLGNLDSKSLSRILVEIEKLKNSAKEIDLDIKLSKDSEKIDTFIKGITERLDVLKSTANGVDISHITRQFHQLTAGSDRNSVVMKSINDDVKNLEQSLKRAGNVASTTGISFRRFFDDLGDSLRTFTLGEVIGDVITDSLYQAWDTIKEMDAAMANLKKVADEVDVNSADKLNSIRDQAIGVAQEVGMASSDVMNAIADTLQAGVGGMQESIQVARSAMILANVGDMAQSEASKSLNTIINGYKLQPLKEIDIQVGNLTEKTTELANAMDLLNYAGNNYAIGADGVADAMQRGGTVLSQYGVTLSDSVAMITATNEAIQDPARIGNGLKSLSINMAGVKAAAKDGSLELNKTAKALSTIAGIDIYSDKAKGEIKGMVEILDELYEKVKAGKLDDDEFKALSEAMAGKEQAAVLQSLIGNYETFKQIRSEFAEGLHFGSAEKENQAYVDSLDGKLNKLREIWIDTLMVLADSDSVKDLFDVFIKVSEGINSFVKALDSVHATFPVLLGLISGGSSAFKTLWNALDEADNAGDGLTNSFGGTMNVLKGGLVPAIKNFVKQGLLIGGITAVVQAGAWAWEELSGGVKKAGEELKTIEEEQLAAISSQNQKIKILEETGVKYEELANKAERTAAEEQELIELGNELAKILPEMVVGYDEEGNAILHMTDDMQGLIDKTKEANEEYSRLLLGTRMEQSDNALKMLTKGEVVGKDSLGLYDQKIKAQNDYNARMSQLQSDYQIELVNATKYEGKTRETALKRMRELKNLMITEESKYQSEYMEIQSRIVQASNEFRDEMDTTWRTSASLLINELTPELEKGIQSFVNTLDFSEISSEEELESVRKVFRELPELAQSGAVDLDKLSSQIAEINKEFSDTGNIEDYNTNMKMLAKSLSEETGWDANVLYEMFTKISDGTLKSSTSLDSFLEAFGKTKQELKNGDGVAEALHTQFVEMERVIERIAGLDFGDYAAVAKFRVELQGNEDIPKQIRDTMHKLVEAGVEDKHIISVTSELMMSLKDGKLDETEIENVKNSLREQLTGKIDEADIEMTINGILESFNSEEILKSIEEKLGDESVTKEVEIVADNPEKVEQINAAMELLESRPDVNKAVKAVVEGDEDLVLFSEIIKNLPTSKEHTNKFIVDNAEALSKLNSYKEVVEYIDKLPDETKKKYGLTTEGVKETAEEIEKIDETINTVNEKELKVTSSNDDVLKTIEDVESLIKISSQVDKGKYKIEIDANTQTAIDNINLLKDSVNGLNSELGKGKSVSYKAETAGAAKNISGLISRVNQIKKLTGKTFKYYANTAQAAKNISGLIDRVNQIKKLSGKTFNYYANTAQAAKNISGLIDRINQINGKTSKTFNYTVNTKEQKSLPTPDISTPEVASYSVSPISDVADEIASQTSSIQASLRTGVGEVNSFSENMSKARATLKTPLAITGNDIYKSIKYSVELLQELENRITKVNNSVSLLDKKMESAVGTNKINYLKEQNTLYQEQISLLKEEEDALKRQHNYYKYYLQNKGFKFNADNNLTNYEEKLLAMKQEEERLQKLADTANDKYNSYTGDNEKTKNNLKASYDAAKKKADDYSASIAETEKFLQEYLKVTFTELPNVADEWQDINNKIAENNREIDKLNRENRLYKFTNGLKKAQMQIEAIADDLDILSKKMELKGNSSESINEYIGLLKKQANIQKEILANYKNSANVYKTDLAKYGFSFDNDGLVTNLDTVLNKYQNSSDLEYIKSILEDYLKIINDELPEAEKSLLDLDLTIQKTLKDQLNTTKEVEQKITDIYKKQIEERIEALNKETDAKVKALKEQQDAYNKYRDEVDYKEEYNEKLENITDLQKQLDIAMRDTSLSGQKKVQELKLQIATAQKELDKLTQSKIDENINDLFDKEAERIEKENETAIENLEKEWSESKIAELVAKALDSGVFTDIEGNVHSLEDVLIKFADESGELFGVLGSIIESELIQNLELAKDTVNDLANIMKEFDLNAYASTQNSRSIENSRSVAATSGSYYNSSNQVSINAPLINIEGNVDANVVQELKSISDKIKSDVIDAIASSIR